jgi:acetoin utilization protein AcuB
MLVRGRMSTRPVTVTCATPITEALRTMREGHVRRLPVLDEQGKMVGIISEKDLIYAAPSLGTSMSIYEVHYYLSRLLVNELMTKDVITVTPDTPLEEAARVMADNKIGGLPVMDGTNLVGIVTETDIFKVFLELLGARQPGLRVTLRIPERKGEIARITTAIAALGGNIQALVTAPEEDPMMAVVTVKVEDVPAETLLSAMRDLGLEVLDARGL